MLTLTITALFFSLFAYPGDALTKERNVELLKYAMENVNSENYEIAEQTLNKLLVLENSNTDALFLRAYCRYKKEENEKALLDLNRLISIDSQYANAYIIRARVHRALGDYWSWLKDYNRARKLDPYLTLFSASKGMFSD